MAYQAVALRQQLHVTLDTGQSHHNRTTSAGVRAGLSLPIKTAWRLRIYTLFSERACAFLGLTAVLGTAQDGGFLLAWG